MFTGIVQAIGNVTTVVPTPSGQRFSFALGGLAERRFGLGDSIAVNGACLTVVELPTGAFAADVSPETLRVTTLGQLAPGSPVNLEPAMTLADPLGGHLVTGHVDGIATVSGWQPDGAGAVARFTLPATLSRYAARKGSITIDGVSLTVNAVDGHVVTVTLVPHTLTHTILGSFRIGTAVNVEVDLVARYVERLLGSA
jgi:riboflavin synthase